MRKSAGLLSPIENQLLSFANFSVSHFGDRLDVFLASLGSDCVAQVGVLTLASVLRLQACACTPSFFLCFMKKVKAERSEF